MKQVSLSTALNKNKVWKIVFLALCVLFFFAIGGFIVQLSTPSTFKNQWALFYISIVSFFVSAIGLIYIYHVRKIITLTLII